MSDEVLVKVDGVSKKFCRSLKRSLYYGIKDISKELFGIQKKGHLRKDEFWAVKNVSFELKRGECLGLIGHNGAGKSTLLKMLNGLIKPDKGKIIMKGRIGALIELGAGFNPILTGRENIYNNGVVLGLKEKEIDTKFKSIVEFAEIDEFIDTPVQNYSSGMKVRLGFAVATQMEPDVLLIDEVLAVGDLKFRIKCFNYLNNILSNTAVIFVSHNMSQISKISTLLMYLREGMEQYRGFDISKGLELYFKNQETEFDSEINKNGVSIIKKNIFISKNLKIVFNIGFKSVHPIKKFTIVMTIFDQEYRPVGIVNSLFQEKYFSFENENKQECFVEIDNLFSNGNYTINVALMSIKDSRTLPFIVFQNALNFNIKNNKFTTHVPLQLIAKWT